MSHQKKSVIKKSLNFGVNSIAVIPEYLVVKWMDPCDNIVGFQRGSELEIKGRKIYRNRDRDEAIYVSIPIDGQITLSCYIK